MCACVLFVLLLLFLLSIHYLHLSISNNSIKNISTPNTSLVVSVCVCLFNEMGCQWSSFWRVHHEEKGTIEYDNRCYNLNKIFEIVHARRAQSLPVGKLVWNIEEMLFDKDIVSTVDTSIPIIIAKIDNEIIIIDGHKRLKKIVTSRTTDSTLSKMIRCKYLYQDELDQCCVAIHTATSAV